MPVYEALKTDKRMKQADMAKIASIVSYDTPPSTKKKEALRRIWLIHDSYATAEVKSKYTSGRSAA